MFALPPRHSQCFAEDRAGIVCRKGGAGAALLAVPAFFTLFFSLLFSLWYLESVSAWLALAGATLVLSMSAATAMFWLASGRSGRPDPSRSQRHTASPPLPTGAAAEARTQPVPLRHERDAHRRLQRLPAQRQPVQGGLLQNGLWGKRLPAGTRLAREVSPRDGGTTGDARAIKRGIPPRTAHAAHHAPCRRAQRFAPTIFASRRSGRCPGHRHR